MAGGVEGIWRRRTKYVRLAPELDSGVMEESLAAAAAHLVVFE